MAKEVSTGIRAFVKDSLNQYYKRFYVKLDDNPSKNSNKSAIKINNDGSIYVYDIGNYTGSVFDDASTLLEVIKAIGQGHGTRVEAGDNIQVDSTETTSTISALGYTYNLEKDSFSEGNNNLAYGNYSHAEGDHTISRNEAEHAEGKYNQSHIGKTIHSIGIGGSEQTRKNAVEVMQDGSIYVLGLGNYDGSTLTNASTLLDICNSKADKIINAIEGHFASLDANGNLQDSGKNSTDFASATHLHNTIIDASTESNISINEGTINIVVEEGGSSREAEINANNIGNLYRALVTPSSVPEDDDTKLITSKAVYGALQEKADSIHTHSGIEEVKNMQSAKLYADNQTQGDPAITIELADNNIPGGSVTKSANIDIDSIDNLNRALDDPDTTPTSDSDKLITSGGVYNGLSGKRNYDYPVIYMVRSQDDFLINGQQVVETSLNSIIENYPSGVLIPCMLSCIYVGHINLASALVSWNPKAYTEDETEVYIHLGTHTYKAEGQTIQGESVVETWTSKFTVIDYSQAFF